MLKSCLSYADTTCMETIHVDLTLDQVIALRGGATVTGCDHRDLNVSHTLDGAKVTTQRGLDLIIGGYPEQVQHGDDQLVEIYVL